MKEGRDLGITLIASTLLLVAVSYLAQCSTSSQRPAPVIDKAAARTEVASPGTEAEREQATGKPKSVRERAEEESNEEREKIQRIGHALQTIGANPELRKTYGLPR